MGRRYADADARSYQDLKPVLREAVLDALADLRARYDVVVCEGAGSPAEINLRAGDLANMGLARAADLPVVLVGDIDRGGVFASLYGSLALLEPDDQALVAGFVINKFRGDDTILAPGLEQLHGADRPPDARRAAVARGHVARRRGLAGARGAAPGGGGRPRWRHARGRRRAAALDEQLHRRRRAHRRARGQRALHALARRRGARRPRARAGDEGDGRGPRAPARRRPRRSAGPPRGRGRPDPRRLRRLPDARRGDRGRGREPPRHGGRPRAAAGPHALRASTSGCAAWPARSRWPAGRRPPATRSATGSRRATAARR